MTDTYDSIVLIPSKIRSFSTIQNALRSETLFIQYRYDIGLEGILGELFEHRE